MDLPWEYDMELKTTQTGLARIKVAENLLLSNCSAINPSKHTGQCITNIIGSIEKNFSSPVFRPPGGNPAYCAATAILIDNIAFPFTGKVNPFINCRNCVSSTEYIAKAKKLGIRVDKIPAPGAVGFARSSLANSGFHTIALVWYIDSKGDIATIEGNSNGYHLDSEGCYTKVANGIITKKRRPSTFSTFVHIEEYQDSGELFAYIPMDNKISLSGLGKGEYCLTALPTQEDIGNEDVIEDSIGYKVEKYVPYAIVFGLFGLFLWSRR